MTCHSARTSGLRASATRSISCVEEINDLRDSRRTETVTWRQFDETLPRRFLEVTASLCVHVRRRSPNALQRLTTIAETLVDITRAFAIERDEGAHSDHSVLGASRPQCQSLVTTGRYAARSRPDQIASRRDRRQSPGKWRWRWSSASCSIPQRMLLSIGFVVPQGALDENCYDLLASEARLASYVGIAKGDLPARHWFRLAHDVTPVGADTALISWSGSMFEYLMPSLVMRAPTVSVLEQTNRVIVRRQIEYGASLGTPWGISEFAYNARDPELTYQYSNFGVPGLGLKRGLGRERCGRSLCDSACSHRRSDSSCAKLRAAGVAKAGRAASVFSRRLIIHLADVPQGQSVAVVRAFMAHHQGMTIVAIADALMEGAMRARFHAEPMIRAAELLLQECMPREVAVRSPWASEATSAAGSGSSSSPATPRRVDPHAATPATQLLSNGRYSVMLTAAGSGYSRWRDSGGNTMARGRQSATTGDRTSI